MNRTEFGIIHPIDASYRVEKEYLNTKKSLQLFDLYGHRPLPSRVSHLALLPNILIQGVIDVVCRVASTAIYIVASGFIFINKTKAEIKFLAVQIFGFNFLNCVTSIISQLIRIHSTVIGIIMPYHGMNGFRIAEKVDHWMLGLKRNLYVKLIPYDNEKIELIKVEKNPENLVSIVPNYAVLYFGQERAKELYNLVYDAQAKNGLREKFHEKLAIVQDLLNKKKDISNMTYKDYRKKCIKKMEKQEPPRKEAIQKAIYDMDLYANECFGFGSTLIIS